MNSNPLVQLLHQGFRVTLGATASLVEILQDPSRREENLARLRAELGDLAEVWEEKGAVTEREARSYVDQFLSQNPGNPGSATITTTAVTVTPPSPAVQTELQELTAQLASIRAELEKLRNQENA